MWHGRDEKAHGASRGPFRAANARKVRESSDAARHPDIGEKPCKFGELTSKDRTTENRGVPGSSPGLAIGNYLQIAISFLLVACC